MLFGARWPEKACSASSISSKAILKLEELKRGRHRNFPCPNFLTQIISNYDAFVHLFGVQKWRKGGGVVEGWSRSKVGSLIVWQPGDPGFL